MVIRTGITYGFHYSYSQFISFSHAEFWNHWYHILHVLYADERNKCNANRRKENGVRFSVKMYIYVLVFSTDRVDGNYFTVESDDTDLLYCVGDGSE